MIIIIIAIITEDTECDGGANVCTAEEKQPHGERAGMNTEIFSTTLTRVQEEETHRIQNGRCNLMNHICNGLSFVDLQNLRQSNVRSPESNMKVRVCRDSCVQLCVTRAPRNRARL